MKPKLIFLTHHLSNLQDVCAKSLTMNAGKRKSIEPDGNCGFRSLSYLLTGTQANHIEMRQDIVKFSEEAIKSHEFHGGNDWWSK
jgi:hypothetical protein